MISGFCNPGNPEDSHHRCRMSSCTCALFADHHNPNRITVVADDTGIAVTLDAGTITPRTPAPLALVAQAVAQARLDLPPTHDRTDYARGRYDALTEVIGWIMYGPPKPTHKEPT